MAQAWAWSAGIPSTPRWQGGALDLERSSAVAGWGFRRFSYNADGNCGRFGVMTARSGVLSRAWRRNSLTTLPSTANAVSPPDRNLATPKAARYLGPLGNRTLGTHGNVLDWRVLGRRHAERRPPPSVGKTRGTALRMASQLLAVLGRQVRRVRRRERLAGVLAGTPVIDVRDLMHAAHGAVRCARLGRSELTPDIGSRVLRQRYAGIPALL